MKQGPVRASLVEKVHRYGKLKFSPYCKKIFSKTILKSWSARMLLFLCVWDRIRPFEKTLLPLLLLKKWLCWLSSNKKCCCFVFQDRIRPLNRRCSLLLSVPFFLKWQQTLCVVLSRWSIIYIYNFKGHTASCFVMHTNMFLNGRRL